MESKASSLGSSLLVPCVQELAKEPLVTVPPRYIRLDQDQPIIADDGPVSEIPVIDMQRLLGQESMDSDSELAKLHFASKEWGFFQVRVYIHFYFLHINLLREFCSPLEIPPSKQY